MLLVTFVTIVLLIASCGYNRKTAYINVAAEQRNDAKFKSNKQENDAQFLINAAQINLEEIKLGELAQRNGRTTYVKELGKTMGAVHTKSLNNLTALAKIKLISIPTSSTENAQETYKKLNQKSGDDFDKVYAEMMVIDHKDAIIAFEKAATHGNDTDIKNWAIVSLTDLRTQLDYSLNCQKKCNN